MSGAYLHTVFDVGNSSTHNNVAKLQSACHDKLLSIIVFNHSDRRGHGFSAHHLIHKVLVLHLVGGGLRHYNAILVNRRHAHIAGETTIQKSLRIAKHCFQCHASRGSIYQSTDIGDSARHWVLCAIAQLKRRIGHSGKGFFLAAILLDKGEQLRLVHGEECPHLSIV